MIRISHGLDSVAFEVEGIEKESPAAIEFNLIELPVFLVVDEINVFDLPGGGTLNLPVVGFVSNALRAISRLKPGATESVTIADAGWLFFSRSEERVRLYTSTFRPNVDAGFEETLSAFYEFRNNVGMMLQTHLPPLRNHPQWDYWFPGESRINPALREYQ